MSVVALRPPAGARPLACWGGWAAAGVAAGVAGVALAAVDPFTLAVLGTVSGGVVLLALAALRFAWFLAAAVALRPALDGVERTGVDPAAVLAVLVPVAVVAWFAVQEAAAAPEGRPRFGPNAAVVVSGAVLVAAAVLAAALAPAPAPGGTADVVRLASTIAVLAAALRLAGDSHGRRALAVGLALAPAVPVAVGVLELARGDGWSVRGMTARTIATFEHPNPLGAFLAVMVTVAVAHLAATRGGRRAVLLAACAAMGACLLGTQSRSAWAAAAVGCTIAAWCSDRRTLPVMAACLAAAAALPVVGGRMADLGTSRQLSGRAANSAEWRLDYWRSSLAAAEGRPLTGVGPGGVRTRLAQGKDPHNDVVRIAAETGAVGMAGYLALGLSLGWRVRDRLRESTGSPARPAAAAAAGCLGVALTLSVGTNLLGVVPVTWPLAVVLALGMAR